MNDSFGVSAPSEILLGWLAALSQRPPRSKPSRLAEIYGAFRPGHLQDKVHDHRQAQAGNIALIDFKI